MIQLPTRQVHLDFHTSEHIRNIGKQFSEKNFQKALKLARVNSVTVFAKCHHSWSYYPTQVGSRHPHLQTDLLGRQIRAAHDIGVRAPIYLTVGWSANDAKTHPGWIVRDRDGKRRSLNIDPKAKPNDARPGVSWRYLDPSGAYKDLIIAQLSEICAMYPVDGIFFDICHGPVSLAPKRLMVMRKMGLNPDSPEDIAEFRTHVWLAFMDETKDVVLQAHPEATIFFNGVASVNSDARFHERQTHLELEDLPTTWGGYDKFPPRAKFFASLVPETPMLAMSGKFHTAWGEFGGFKHPDAIRFEASTMMAAGAACSFGDQLHPSGEMDLETYRNIGHAYKYVQEIEQFSVNAKPVSNLGLWIPSGASSPIGDMPPEYQGVANMLMDRQIDFETITDSADSIQLETLSRFQTIILPGQRVITRHSSKIFTEYLRTGGSLVVLGESVLFAHSGKLALPIGGRYLGPARFDVDYTLAGASIGKGLVRSPFLNYSAAHRVVPTDGAVLAYLREPFFSRTYARYSSHLNTPNQLENAKHVAALQRGRVIYLAHSLGRMYLEHGAYIHRDFFVNALQRVYTNPMLTVIDFPTGGRINLMHQPDERRFVLHLLYAPPIQRCRCLVIEDRPVIRDASVSFKPPVKILRALLPLTSRKLNLDNRSHSVRIEIPEVFGHQLVTFNY